MVAGRWSADDSKIILLSTIDCRLSTFLLKQRTQKISSRSKIGKDLKIALIASRFNEEICDGLVNGASGALKEAGIISVDIFRVPGAFEIPLAAKKCALSKKYNGLVALGAVIRGETPHFEYISQAVTQGISQVSLESGLPVGFGVITVNTLAQAKARSASDEYNKGREATLTVLEMVDLLKSIGRH